MWIAVDTETTSLDFTDCELLGLGYYTPRSKGYLTDKQEILKFFQKHNKDLFIWQNGKFDQKVLWSHLGIVVPNNFDTLLAASLAADKPDSLSLDSLVNHYLGFPSWKDKDFIGNLKNKPVEEQAAYCLADCERTYQLKDILEQRLTEGGNLWFFQNYLMPISNFLVRAEILGIAIDTEKLQRLQQESLKTISDKDLALYASVKDLVKPLEDTRIEKHYMKHPKTKLSEEDLRNKPANRFNFSSPTQRLFLLKDVLKFPCEKIEWDRGRKKVSYSAAKPIIQEYAGQHPVIDSILELEALKSEEEAIARFLEFTRRDGRIHTSINLHRADTGRTSSSDPPLQNVPREGGLRDCFVAKPGYKLVVIDYSQVEFRIAAHFTRDPVMVDAFHKGIDIYAVLANEVQGTNYDPNKMKKEHPEVRNFGKVMGLSAAYGVGPDKLAGEIRKKLKIPCDFAIAKKHIESYFIKFRGLHQGRINAYQEVLQKGYVETLFGRRVYVSKKDAQHTAFNYKIQPSASDLLLISQLWVEAEKQIYNFDASFLLPVHDETIWEVREDQAENFAQLATMTMKHGWRKYAPWINLQLPLDAECYIGNSWGCKN